MVPPLYTLSNFLFVSPEEMNNAKYHTLDHHSREKAHEINDNINR